MLDKFQVKFEYEQETEECVICSEHKISTNMHCFKCNKYMCIQCCNSLTSRTSLMFTEKKQIFIKYQCPFCRYINNKHIKLFNKNEIISGLTNGIAGLFKKNKVSHFEGVGKFIDKNTVELTKLDGSKEVVNAKYFIIATGSEVAKLPNVEIDEKIIVSSTGALDLEKVPAKMIIIGAGVIVIPLESSVSITLVLNVKLPTDSPPVALVQMPPTYFITWFACGLLILTSDSVVILVVDRSARYPAPFVS